MSSNAKHYDYYMVEGDDVKKVINAYDDIQKRRNEILGDAMKRLALSLLLRHVAGARSVVAYLRALCGVSSLNFRAK